jgi:hypothetical protein
MVIVVHVDGVRLSLNCGPLFILQTTHEYGQPLWNDIDTKENLRTRRKTCPSVTLSATWADPGLRDVRPTTNRLSQDTAMLNG